jgi:hypothetical protein
MRPIELFTNSAWSTVATASHDSQQARMSGATSDVPMTRPTLYLLLPTVVALVPGTIQRP